MESVTSNEERSFIQALGDRFTDGLLDKCLDWIALTLTPDKVFEEEELVGWVRVNKQPEDVFSNEELKAWAKNAGFVEGE